MPKTVYDQYYIFVKFQAKTENEPNPDTKILLYNTALSVLFEYLYISAGGISLMLAFMQICTEYSAQGRRMVQHRQNIIVDLALLFVSIISFDKVIGYFSALCKHPPDRFPRDTLPARGPGRGTISSSLWPRSTDIVSENIRRNAKQTLSGTKLSSETQLCRYQQQIRWQDEEHETGIESQNTLLEVPPSRIQQRRKYSQIRQHDAVDESAIELDQQMWLTQNECRAKVKNQKVVLMAILMRVGRAPNQLLAHL